MACTKRLVIAVVNRKNKINSKQREDVDRSFPDVLARGQNKQVLVHSLFLYIFHLPHLIKQGFI